MSLQQPWSRLFEREIKSRYIFENKKRYCVRKMFLIPSNSYRFKFTRIYYMNFHVEKISTLFETIKEVFKKTKGDTFILSNFELINAEFLQ